MTRAPSLTFRGSSAGGWTAVICAILPNGLTLYQKIVSGLALEEGE